MTALSSTATLAQCVVDRLSKACCHDKDVSASPTSQAAGAQASPEHQHRHAQLLSESWTARVVVFSTLSCSSLSVLTQPQALQNFMELAATQILPSPEATSATFGWEIPCSSTQLITDLLDLLLGQRVTPHTFLGPHVPESQEEIMSSLCPSAGIAASSWQQQGLTFRQSSEAQPVNDSTVVLRSTLLLIKLLSMLTTQHTNSSDGVKNVTEVLWTTLSLVLHLISYFMCSFSWEPKQHSLVTPEHLEQQHLTLAISELVVPLLRLSLKQQAGYTRIVCISLQHVVALSSAPGCPAGVNLVNSGMLYIVDTCSLASRSSHSSLHKRCMPSS